MCRELCLVFHLYQKPGGPCVPLPWRPEGLLWGGLGKLIGTCAMNKSRCDFSVEVGVISSAVVKRKEKLIHLLPFHRSLQSCAEVGQAQHMCWE